MMVAVAAVTVAAVAAVVVAVAAGIAPIPVLVRVLALAMPAVVVRVLAAMAMGRHAPTLTRIALPRRTEPRARGAISSARAPAETLMNSKSYWTSAAPCRGFRLARFESLRTLGHV